MFRSHNYLKSVPFELINLYMLTRKCMFFRFFGVSAKTRNSKLTAVFLAFPLVNFSKTLFSYKKLNYIYLELAPGALIFGIRTGCVYLRGALIRGVGGASLIIQLHRKHLPVNNNIS